MAINSYDARKRLVKVEYAGLVVDIRSWNDLRNVSPTLDYSDWRSVQCTAAVVFTYKGSISEAGALLEENISYCFKHVDISEYRYWNFDHYTRAEIDAPPELLALWERAKAERQRLFELAEAQRAAQREATAAAHRERVEREERNRPVVGKRVRVVRGRKVPVGTIGTIAYIHSSGRVLLKDDSVWQDRSAPGTWVDPNYLEARD